MEPENTTPAQTQATQNSAPQGTPTPAPAANNDMVMGILAYIIFFVPLLAGANSPFVRFHTNQGLVLFIFWVAGWIIPMFLPMLFLLMPFYSLALLAFAILGIVHVAKNEMKPLPLIGGIQILK